MEHHEPKKDLYHIDSCTDVFAVPAAIKTGKTLPSGPYKYYNPEDPHAVIAIAGADTDPTKALKDLPILKDVSAELSAHKTQLDSLTTDAAAKDKVREMIHDVLFRGVKFRNSR